MNPALLILACWSFALAGPSPGSGSYDAADTRLTERVADLVATDFSGAVLVAAGGEVLFARGIGQANLGWQVDNAADTKFRIASLSKTFTAVLVLQEVDKGRLSLDDRLETLLPAFKAGYADRVSLRHLLAHRSGISHYIDLPGWFEGAYLAPRTTTSFLRDIAALPLNAEPGGQYRYSNANYFLLGQILQRLSGKSFVDLLTENILRPLAMEATGHFTHAAVLAKMAQNYVRNEQGQLLRADPINDDLFLATGSLYATVGDLFTWQQALAKGKLLSARTRAIMFNQEDPIGWTFGKLALPGQHQPEILWSYNGELNGFTSMISFLPEKDHVVIVLNNNNAGFQALQSISHQLLKTLSSSKNP